MAYRVVHPEDPAWETRPAEPGEPRRHTAELSERAGLRQARANLWRYEPGAKGRRHRHEHQEETFVVLRGTLTMYLGDLAEREQVGEGGLIHVTPRTPLQTVNESDEELLLYAHGWPPEVEHAEILAPAV